MNMKQCAQGGHYYDASVHSDCPYCNAAPAGSTMAMDRTMAITGGGPMPDVGKTMPLAPPTAPVRNAGPVGGDDGRTVAIIKEDLGVDPVVGWLVNLDGKEKGRDYRIHTDNNYIGRGEKMDICIRGDDTISREHHATISFDSRDKVYYFTPGDGRSIVRLNDKGVFSTVEIKAYDTLEIGKTKLVFIPLCGDKFEWA